MASARVVLEVQAGVIPGSPDPERTRRWAITTEEWEAADPPRQVELLATRNGEALGYAALLMVQPDKVNWVRTDWLWL